MKAEEKLSALGLTLPPPPQPAGSYTRAVRSGQQIFVSGQLPLFEGTVQFCGKVGEDLEVDQGYEAAKLCALNALSILRAEAGDLDGVRIVRVGGYVCSSEGFTGQPQVVNGASDLLAEVLGERGIHARIAVGVSALPLNAAVELEVIAEIID